MNPIAVEGRTNWMELSIVGRERMKFNTAVMAWGEPVIRQTRWLVFGK